MSLVVVAVALPSRAAAVAFSGVFSHWSVIVTLLCGSIVGAWWGAGRVTRIHSARLYKIIAVLLVGVAGVLLFTHRFSAQQAAFTGWALAAAGVVAGFGIGAFAALLGVAGGELLIPTIGVLWGIDIKLAGSLSLAVSIPTMIAAFSRYSRDRSFQVAQAAARHRHHGGRICCWKLGRRQTSRSRTQRRPSAFARCDTGHIGGEGMASFDSGWNLTRA